MRRRIQGLRDTASSSNDDVRDGIYLVRVDRAQYRWHRQKPSYLLQLSVVEPQELAGHVLSGRLYCSARALWKLGWFLRDFLYDPELLSQEEVDEKVMAGLRGVVKVSHVTVHGASLLNFDGFAPASQWPALCSTTTLAPKPGTEVA